MALPLGHAKTYMALVIQQLAEDMRTREQVRVASFRERRGSYVALSPRAEPQEKS